MKEHEHKYIAGTIGDECEFCGLLKSTIEANEYNSDPTEVTWDCKLNQWCEIGCPHRNWSKEDLLLALISKKKFEQSKLLGTILTDNALLLKNK